MDNTSLTLIGVLAVLILISAYFSATETAFSSLNRIRMKNLAKDGDKKARLVLNLCADYDRLLSTILIGNNIVNIASASLATVICVKYFGDAGVTISTVIMTIVVLIFGEITPKSLAKDAPESFALVSAPVLRVLVFILKPLNFFFMQWKKLLSCIFKVADRQSITEEELLTIVEEAQHDGGIDAQEGELIRSAIEFNDVDVVDILTPRVDMMAVEEQASKEEISKVFFETGYSRLPVYKGNVDHIIGVINQKDFTNYIYHTEKTEKTIKTIASVIKPVVFITDSMKISKLLKLLQQKKCHIAVVSDEYGGTAGIVTLEDVIEELVGEIWDEHDEVVNAFKKIGENDYLISCKVNLDKMFDLFNIDKEFDVTSVSGWIANELGRIPRAGDSFTFENLTITVTKADERRVIEANIIKNDVEIPKEN